MAVRRVRPPQPLAPHGLPGHLVGFTLLSALSLLALLEHWFMVLPLPDQKLWRWMIPQPPRPQPVTTPVTDTALTNRKH